MGELLWEHVRPVLRRVRKVLNLASRIAVVDDAEKITKEHIKEALHSTPEGKEEDEVEDAVAEDEDDGRPEEQQQGAHERESERRQDIKRKSSGSGKKPSS